MQYDTIFDDIVAREFKALCDRCVHQHDCAYRKASSKAIIQCELFEEEIVPTDREPDRGLCAMCDRADCSLPGRKTGVWRCNEFM